MNSKRPGLLVHSWYIVHGVSGQWRIDQCYFEATDYKSVLCLPCWSWFGMNLLPVRHLRTRHRAPTIHGKRFQGWMCELSTSSDKDSSLWDELKCKRNKATIEHTNINIHETLKIVREYEKDLTRFNKCSPDICGIIDIFQSKVVLFLISRLMSVVFIREFLTPLSIFLFNIFDETSYKSPASERLGTEKSCRDSLILLRHFILKTEKQAVAYECASLK